MLALGRSVLRSPLKGITTTSASKESSILVPKASAFSTSSTRLQSRFNGSTDQGLTESQREVRESILSICSQFDDDYWRQRDQTETYPHELYDALCEQGYIGACIPTHLGGVGLGISEATIMMQSIAESGASVAGAQSIHANIYPVMPLIALGTDAQKKDWLPRIIDGRIRSCFGVTEPQTGSETLKLRTTAKKLGKKFIVNGQKVWTSSAQVASHIVLLVRTSIPSENESRSSGLSLFFAPIRDLPNNSHNSSSSTKLYPGVSMTKIPKLGGNCVDANQIFFDDFEIDESNLVGKEGEGFKAILHGMNAERCLLAGEALGTGYLALKKAVEFSSERIVFEKSIGTFQAIQHPLVVRWIELEAAKLLTYNAAKMYDEEGSDPKETGAQANAAKYLAAEAGFKACETAVMTLGGMGYAKDYHVERYLREILVPRLAPVSREMVLNYLAQRVLGLPKSY